jgi:hypothetical protein
MKTNQQGEKKMETEKLVIDTNIKLITEKEWVINNFNLVHKDCVNYAKTISDMALRDFNEKFPNDVNGEPAYCGFAWVVVFDVKLNTRLGKAMKACGFRKEYGGGISIWNPSDYHGQSMDIKETGARAYAEMLRSYGFNAYMNSRAD